MSDVVLTQDGRWLTMDSPLGADVLIPTGLAGEERLSTLFLFTVDVLSSDDAIDPATLLGKSVTVRVRRGEDLDPRPFNGIVKSMAGGPLVVHGYRAYRLEVVPTFWLLTKTSDCRIFQTQSALDIIKAVLSEGGVSALETSGVTSQPAQRDYCVQYNETDFAFVSRLLEEEGLFYTFRHEDGTHTMVLGDAPSAYAPCDDADAYYRSGGRAHADGVFAWTGGAWFRTGKVVHDDYDFEAPSTDLKAETSTVLDPADFKSWEHYEYPGRYVKKDRGSALARVRMEAEEAEYQVAEGSGAYRMFSPGQTFTLKEHPLPTVADTEHVLLSVRHQASDESHFSGGGGSSYANGFTCLPATVPFRPARKTPKAVVRGPQTAMVVGPSGEEIHTDTYGRVRCQFHWDRLGKSDEKSSCWIRVAQMWAGRQWGTLFIPRIGMEVVVEFLEGDPDRPLVTGCVYNAETMPPYTLPANKTQSGIKTRSSAKGGTADFNELRFEDKKGSEEVYVHAQKDYTRFVENDDTLTVEHDQTQTVKNNRTRTVSEGNESVTVAKGNQTITVSEGNQSVTVSQGDRTIAVSQGDQSTTVSMGDQTNTLGQGNQTNTLSQGNHTTTCSLGKITLEAMQSIELKVGANSIKIDQSGVTIKGTMVTVEGQATTTVKAPMTTVEGQGMLTLKGGVTMIN
ncbi:type VI secretion system Vgr family protein [Roseospira visakhapatnamensis]|uniref:Type VI secretion system secreted protein VgrG n=1 Tax=Roseospira visakhapatnamensis TaxID=390880 RepID=A0A7W6RBF1_9PROT|nr:type VI secretion system tip protein VgrG [Roseospira visakhapatnamensis]MBB4264763.1 type VI secretion system secreted protein VgrG [Roseospira visakhapatnamensis]